MRYAFLIAYDGSSYFGFVRQPNVPTVEARLLSAFRKSELLQNPKEAGYRIAARTDRAVSALAQVVAFDVCREPDIHTLNSELPADIAVFSFVTVQKDFDPRKEVLTKHYRYVCSVPSGFDFEVARKAIRLLEGAHDFRCFCKREPGGNTKNRILHASIRMDGFLTFDFIAKLFLRQQVRRMVQGLLELGQGVIGIDQFSRAVDGENPRLFKPAPPEGLFLAGMRYRKIVFRLNREAVRKFKEFLKTKEDPRAREMLKLLGVQ